MGVNELERIDSLSKVEALKPQTGREYFAAEHAEISAGATTDIYFIKTIDILRHLLERLLQGEPRPKTGSHGFECSWNGIACCFHALVARIAHSQHHEGAYTCRYRHCSYRTCSDQTDETSQHGHERDDNRHERFGRSGHAAAIEQVHGFVNHIGRFRPLEDHLRRRHEEGIAVAQAPQHEVRDAQLLTLCGEYRLAAMQHLSCNPKHRSGERERGHDR